jgi:hypothetical protein
MEEGGMRGFEFFGGNCITSSIENLETAACLKWSGRGGAGGCVGRLAAAARNKVFFEFFFPKNPDYYRQELCG